MKKLESALWVTFLIWSAVGLFVLGFGLGPEWIRAHVEEGPLRAFLLGVERMGDAAWMAFAATLLLVRVFRASGAKTTLAAFSGVVVLSGLVEAVGAKTGFPFGPYEYSGRFGPMFAGLVPIAIPLAWWVVVEGGRSLAAALGFSGWKGVGIATAAAVLTDVNLEPVAWKIRGYWEWYPGVTDPPWHPPLANYMAWAVLAAVLVLLCDRCAVKRTRPWLSAGVLALVNLFFLVARFGG